MLMIRIRDYEDGDAESISDISNKAFSDEIERGMNHFTPKWCRNWYQRKGTKIFVAEEDSAL